MDKLFKGRQFMEFQTKKLFIGLVLFGISNLSRYSPALINYNQEDPVQNIFRKSAAHLTLSPSLGMMISSIGIPLHFAIPIGYVFETIKEAKQCDGGNGFIPDLIANQGCELSDSLTGLCTTTFTTTLSLFRSKKRNKINKN